MAEFNSSQAREKAMFRYTSALDRGDFETVAEVLALAETDPILAQMIQEGDEVAAQEIEQEWNANRLSRSRSWEKRIGGFAGIAATVMLVGFVIIALLTLLGPATGNVFSSIIVANLPDGSGTPVPAIALEPTTHSPNFPAGTPTSSIVEFQSTPAPTATAPGTQAQSTPGVPVSPQAPMIIKNGEIDLLVKDTTIAIDQVTQIAGDNGGYVISSQAVDTGDTKTATMTIGVRADQFDTAMRRLRQIAIKVQREISSGQDVSSEYVDLQSRLRNLEATRDRVQALLAQAKTVTEAMQINQQLSDIEGQIEQIEGRMTYLSGRAAYSTITITLIQQVNVTPTPTPTATPSPTPTSPWSLGPTIDTATHTQVDLVRGLLELLTWVILVPGPYLLVAAVAWWGYRHWKK